MFHDELPIRECVQNQLQNGGDLMCGHVVEPDDTYVDVTLRQGQTCGTRPKQTQPDILTRKNLAYDELQSFYENIPKMQYQV